MSETISIIEQPEQPDTRYVVQWQDGVTWYDLDGRQTLDDARRLLGRWRKHGRPNASRIVKRVTTVTDTEVLCRPLPGEVTP
jgi:hypothetical protein